MNILVKTAAGRKFRVSGIWIILVLFALLLIAIIKFGRFPEYVFGYVNEAFFGMGAFAVFVLGFGMMKERWLVQNTPTSKIRSVAMGLAEIAGIAGVKYPLKSPLSLADCVFYKFLVERRTRDSKGRTHWSTVRSGESSVYFYAEDATGKILVDPLGADAMLTQDYRDTRGDMRYTEWYIQPKDYVYVLGSVGKFKDNIASRQEKVTERLRAIKTDKEQMDKLDTDKDGRISAEEWDAARVRAEQDVLEEELKNPPPPEDDLVIARGTGEAFIICDRDEKTVRGILFWRSFAAIFISGLVFVAMAGSMLARAGLLPPQFAIPWESIYGLN